ncbi:MAG: hypothetical protein KAS22_07465 [Candidatus Heimdallarchaeota archaeon]|nr:hypothetical protein [Candidatus Heimdallarchaeota archaeon]
MSNEEEHIKELEISTFSKPILREMGVKAVFLVTFDIILGPIAYINKLTQENSEYLEFLKSLAHLGEFYTGISHAQIDKVTTRTGEELIVGRAIRKVNKTEFIDVAVALVDYLEYQDEIVKMLKFAVRTSYGNPVNFSDLIDRVLLEYQDIGKKKAAIRGSKTKFKDLVIEKQRNVGKLSENWEGILFIDFEGDKVNSSFLPDWIEGNKMDPLDIALQVRDMYSQGVIIPRKKQKFTMVSLKGKQAIIVSTSNLRFSSILFPTQNGLTKIPSLVQEIDVLNEALTEAGLNFNSEAMNKTLEIIDQRIIKNVKEHMVKEVIVLMIQAEQLMPKKLIKQEEYESFEGELQKKYFDGFGKAYAEFDGTKTVMEITHKVNTTLDKMANFVVFCMTRGIVQVFTKNTRK